MSAASTAAALAASQAAQTAATLSASIVKQNHQADQNLVALLQNAVEAGQEAIAGSDTAAGVGETVDVKA